MGLYVQMMEVRMSTCAGSIEHIVGDGAELLEKGDRVNYDMPEDAGGLWAKNVSKEEQRRYS
jgi:hypothetical protein